MHDNHPESAGSLAAEAPLRSELFTADQMAEHGRRLAAVHALTPERGEDRLRARLADNETLLVETCAMLQKQTEAQRPITPAGEWLLDNFYLIEEEIRTAKLHLPAAYSRELPRLARGPSAALPRVYDLALQMVAHSDARLHRGTASRFVAAYQESQALRLGELWAFPIMLRLALIENLRRVAARVAVALQERNLAATWAEQMLDAAEHDPKGLILVIADMARSDPPMTGPFVSELARRLQGRSAALALPLNWIEQRLEESHRSIEQLVHLEAQQQAANQVSVSNSIGSLRLIGAMDWREWVETLSLVEQALREDPADTYARMDFASRDRCRHAVEQMGKASPRSEPEIARAALALARAAPGEGAQSHHRHVGHWLIGEGRLALERETGVRPGAALRWRRRLARRPVLHYSAAVIGLTLLLWLLAVGGAGGRGDPPAWHGPGGAWLLLPALALFVALSQLGMTLVNWIASLATVPQPLPRMDFSGGIPPAWRTIVVVPTLLGSEAGIDTLVDALEVRHVANPDAQLLYALLGDFHDAASETMPGDAALIAHASARIEALNARYGGGFFLLHRPRRWNERERRWMGHERKRGKLAELNALLRLDDPAAGSDRFSHIVGDTTRLRGVRLVITLDSDTQLPRDAACQLVATMAHPLNRPRFGGTIDAPVVTGGHGILQPRIGASLPGTTRSRLARLFGGDPGIDPYTRAVSDTYQDLFDEGSFIGKGIYDIDAFEHVLAGRLPENRILSHDLLEGSYARAGLVSDVELVEEPVLRYDTDVERRHRWIRGDWQLAAWLLPSIRTPRTGTRRIRNPLSALSRGKILDNLRRSLVPAAMLAMLLLGWTVLQPAAWWTLVIVAIVFVPPVVALAVDALRKPAGVALGQHLAATWPGARRHLGQAALSLVVLPHEAVYSLDAALRTIGRLAFTRRRLLEWTASADVKPRAPPGSLADLIAMTVRLWSAPALAIAAAVAIVVAQPIALVAAAPLLLAWLVSPVVVWWLSMPQPRAPADLSAAQWRGLRLLARRTWGWFEAFVGSVDHALPPDNVQEQPVPRIAHRTSPTNIGLALLGDLAAWDFGWLSTDELIARCGATLDTMESLERHQGHFYNWYDTRTLQPLKPAYVSTVDSGNLAGYLLVLRAGLAAIADAPLPPAQAIGRLLDGIGDTLQLLRSAGADPRHERLARLLDTARAEAKAQAGELRPHLEALLQAVTALVEALGAEPPDAEATEAAPLPEPQRWAAALRRQCRAALAETHAQEPALQRTRVVALRQLADRAGALADMDIDFLYDPARKLFSIGMNVDERRRDIGYYDLLASEIRLAAFVAVAQGRVPQESWFALGRLLTTVDGEPVLLSWSGSMFEYLMPMLVMPSYENTLLDQTMRTAVARQVRYGARRGVPWGISESGYHATDAALNYQYRAFGVPGLGLKRGLGEDLVVAPYATVLALMVDPRAAVRNLDRLRGEGLAGTFGLHEAIDYTAARRPRGAAAAVVRSYMAHHQGMSLLALAHVLLDAPMQRRFAADARLAATLLLLQERIPKAVTFHPHTAERTAELRPGGGGTELPLRLITTPHTPAPQVQLLSNGRYHVMLTHTGGGTSRWRDLAVTRWREDTTTDAWGSFCYLRDLDSETLWSTTWQPTKRQPDAFEAIFTEGRAEFRRRDDDIDCYTEVVVSPEDDIELRRVRLTNLGATRRRIELTTYTEIVLAPQPADVQHPAFGKLFVQTEALDDASALLATRRPRDATEAVPWMCQLVAVHGALSGPATHETDRARFIGRGRDLESPAALQAADLSGSAGSVLDPVMATRRVVTIEPGRTAVVDIVYGMADTREACMAYLAKYADRRLADRVFELAWTHSQVVLRQLNAVEADTELYARLAGALLFAQGTHRADAALLASNRRPQSGLWGYAISGDLPIVLLQVGDATNLELVRQLVQAHAWWRLKGLAVDLVIWNDSRDVYRQRLHDQILGLIAAGVEAHVMDRPGGIFVRHADQIAPDDRVLLQAVARVIVNDRLGTLAEQVLRKPMPERRPAPLVAAREPEPMPGRLPPLPALQFDNGTGGFGAGGREYVIAPGAGQRPPAPWINVIANPRFGCIVSEAGSGYTWCENAHELRLTPWHNDPVTDAGGEAIWLRDEDTGQAWTATSLPRDAAGAPPYRTRHGFGYSVFEHLEAGIRSELTVFVAIDEAVKFSVLRVRNDGPGERRLSATAYVEWVLGDHRAKTAPHVRTQVSAAHGAILARNPLHNDFGDWIGWFDIDDTDRTLGSWTCDRAEFIGRNGSLRAPAALGRVRLSGRTGPALDPCAAFQVPFELQPGQSREIVFRLGMGRSVDETDKLVPRFRGSAAAQAALDAVHAHWGDVLGGVQVRTPDAAVNLLANGWLAYQTIACRLWARSGYYQSGGAYGFRDQLQDAMALVHADPDALRAQLLLAASRQFAEGDVQHWWHPPGGRGVRTHFSDDFLWLPLALARYVEATADAAVLDEDVPFIDGRPVAPDQESYYDLPGPSSSAASLYEHAVRVIRRAFRYGARGLPLIGAGDWNDGMNRIGAAGRGESVWLGFFLCEVLQRFAPIARARGDAVFAGQCESERAALAQRLEQHGWDGAWYRRAYFDDGTPLGSASNVECRIDSIAQSWSVLSGVAPPERAHAAMDSLAKHLVRDEARLVQLLDPPFDRRGPDPGYIAGYVPGVRENGGQYTHAAIWAAMAFAELGDEARAWQLTEMILPVNHARDAAEVEVYKVEPYVVAADVYSVSPHTGRGGWSWYTGSAGWMLRLLLESLLGLRLVADSPSGARLHVAPCLPPHWSGFSVAYRWRGTRYDIAVEVGSTASIVLDGSAVEGDALPLVDDGAEHAVRITVQRKVRPNSA